MSEPAVVYRYTGDGTYYLNDVPARDLTAEDVALLTEERVAAVEASDLYESVGAAPPPAAAPATEEA